MIASRSPIDITTLVTRIATHVKALDNAQVTYLPWGEEYQFRPQPDVGKPALVEGAGLQLRNKEVYLEYVTPTSLSGWHSQWFYIGNHKPSLPRRDNAPPQCQDCWLEKLLEEESHEIPELMKRI
ncbi:retrotransposon protein, putative, Ty3-gypsy subclass [Panicum miliaceum]|uniref:Retrotransposon protein, putative, Ty3-gypsy subclass n=1 Tax=Panicum miliaceum TaxID=4540 RepID=A0A3L6SLH2_PANMI|nr:retrotransposon protein, putative, Ty3-gypsy subclass [Panicum miliaceum]